VKKLIKSEFSLIGIESDAVTWPQQANENPTAARQFSAVRFSDKHCEILSTGQIHLIAPCLVNQAIQVCNPIPGRFREYFF